MQHILLISKYLISITNIIFCNILEYPEEQQIHRLRHYFVIKKEGSQKIKRISSIRFIDFQITKKNHQM